MPESVGQFEQIILTAILSLRDRAYGVTIHERALELAAPKSVSLGAVYVTLDRLEAKGYLTSWLADPTPQRGGRAKRYYALKPRAVQALRDGKQALQALWRGLDGVLGRA